MYGFPSSYNKNYHPNGYPVAAILPETIDFQIRMIANGGNILTDSELYAVNWRIWQYKYYKLWDKDIATTVLVGGNGNTGSVASFCTYIKSVPYIMVAGGGVTDGMCNPSGYRNTGSVSNGSTVFLNSRVQHSLLDLNNIGMSCYIRSIVNKNNIVDMGVAENSLVTRMTLYANYNLSTRTIQSEIGTTASATISGITVYTGMISCNKFNTLLNLSYNGSIVAGINTYDTTLLNANVYFASWNRIGVGAVDLSTREYGMFSIHQAYTPYEERIAAYIEQNFQNLLGRAVII